MSISVGLCHLDLTVDFEKAYWIITTHLTMRVMIDNFIAISCSVFTAKYIDHDPTAKQLVMIEVA